MTDDRIVYVVLAHRLPSQVSRLISLIQSQHDSVVMLHYDGDDLRVDSNVIPIERRAVSWGGMSIPRLFLDALVQAVSVPRAAWIVIVSGQDYPLRPLEQIHADLLASRFDVHLDSHAVREGTPWPMWEPLTRYGYRFAIMPVDLPGRLRRRVWPLISRSCENVQRRSSRTSDEQQWERLPAFVLRNVGARLAVGRRREDNPFLQGELHAGDAWFSVRVDAARRILDAVAINDRFMRYMSRTLVPDEALFQSLIANKLPELRVGPWRRHRLFRQGESHPHVWRTPELPILLQTGADFARKFDINVDAAILDCLDEVIGRS